MTTTDEQSVEADRLRGTIAVTKDQLRKLHRFMQVGKARIVSGNLSAESGYGSDGPGNNTLPLAFDTPVPFTMPWRDSRSTRDHGDQRLTATGVVVSDNGVHLLASFTPLVGNDTTKDVTSRPRSTRWVRIDDVARVEQAI